MTNIKTLGAVVVLAAFIAAPVFAKDVGVAGRHHVRAQHRSHFHAAYNQRNEHFNPQNERFDPDPYFQRNIENFGFSGRDPSRIGGEDPSLHPSPY